mgnify:CR=1 FL=1
MAAVYTGVFYLVFVGILTLLFNYIEKKAGLFQVGGRHGNF